MGFPYVVQLENVDTNEKYFHKLHSHQKDQVFNDKKQINYQSIVEFIMLYEPQCDRDMLLIMSKEDDNWVFMLPNFTFDLNNKVSHDEISEKGKVGTSKIGSKILSSNSQLQLSMITSHKLPQKNQTILQIRFQCQLWTDQPQTQTFQKSMYSQKGPKNNINLAQKMKQVKIKINQIEKFAQQLHQMEADAIGINVFWANPYFATDGIDRKYVKEDTKKKQVTQSENKFLKLSVKCIPYVEMIAQQIKQSNKKVKLNIDQFNHHSFSLRNVFNIVYLICHTQVAMIRKQDIKKKFNRNPEQFTNENLSKISQKSANNHEQGQINIQQNQRMFDIKLQNLEDVNEGESHQDKVQGNSQRGVKMKKTQSLNLFQQLTPIDEEKQSDNMTERKQSCDYFLLNDVQQSDLPPNKLLQSYSQHRGLQNNKIKELSPSSHAEAQQNLLSKAFGHSQQNNLISVYHEQNFQYNKLKYQKSKSHLYRRSRSNSKHSLSSKGNSKSRKSKSKQKLQKESISKIHQKAKHSSNHQQLNSIQLLNVTRSKKNQKKIEKSERYKQKKIAQNKKKKDQQKKAITYLIGQNKQGELEKITPQDLDNMLKQKMLQNVELFIIHTSYSSSHLPVLRKYANNILVINSNPIYPQSSTFFFLRYFFKHLFETKNIRSAHNKALMETSYMYRRQSSDIFENKFHTLYQAEKDSLQRLKFDHVMQKIRKKHIYSGSYLCCCYHPHDIHCIFRKNKTTSKYGDAHYKFHVNRCDCHHSNPMIHYCKSKKQTLGEYNIIDKKDYHSKIVYNCCCLGVQMGKYKEKRKNKECFELPIGQNEDDPHQITHKFTLETGQYLQYLTNRKNTINSLQLENQNQQQEINKRIEQMNFQQGTVQGSYNENFQKSLKYLNDNDLLGNSKVIADLLVFFSGGNKTNPYQSQVKDDIKNEPIKITNSMIRQTKIVNQAQKSNRNSSHQPWVCNMFGQNSSGRKTISKYLAHLMVIKKIFDKVIIRYFSKVQELKYLQTDEKMPIFYILVYKPLKKHQKVNFENLNQIKLDKNLLPALLRCIIVTNKQIEFDKSIRSTSKTPRQLNEEQMKTYVKLYQHLTSEQKNKLNQFVQLTNLNKKCNRDQKDKHEEKQMKIFANQIDSYEIISIIRTSNYHNQKYKNYLQSVSKIDPISLPSYIFVTGIIFQTLKHFQSTNNKQIKRIKQNFIDEMNKQLKRFMNEGKAFYLFFDPKRNKKNSKKPKHDKDPNLTTQISEQMLQIQRMSSINQKQSQNQEQRFFKQEVIYLSNIEKYHPLLYQSFRKQISSRYLECMKAYIYYTTVQENPVFSLKDSAFSKGSLNHFSRNFCNDQHQYRTRKIAYQSQFYQSTSLNENSFFSMILQKKMKNYQFNFNQSSNYQNQKSMQSKQKLQLLKKPVIEEKKSLVELVKFVNEKNKIVSQHFKQALDDFFTAYVKSFHNQNQNQITRIQSRDSQSHQSASHKNINDIHFNFTPKKQIYESPKHIKSQSLPQREKKSQTVQSKKKIEIKSKAINFQQDEKHLYCIMSAGLLYLRRATCSHMIYNLLDKNDMLELLESGLILINNALILMKTPHFKVEETQFSVPYNYYQDIDSVNSQSSGEDFLQHQQHSDENILRHPFQNQSPTKEKNQALAFSQAVQFHEKHQTKKIKSQIQEELQQPFSIKGLLYLLCKIRQRFDSLFRGLINDNNKDEADYVKKLTIINEFFILQLHLSNIAKGENYEQQLLKFQKTQKTQKYFSQIFYDKGRSLNYLKECLRELKFQKPQIEVMQNQVLSAYIMMVTNYGRKKINQNIRAQIVRLTKFEEDQKAIRKQSCHQTDKCDKKDEKKQKQKALDSLPKMRILQKISENNDIYSEIKSLFVNFQIIKIPLTSIKLIDKKSSDSSLFQNRHKHDSGSNKSQYQRESERSKSHQVILLNQFESQTQIYQKLLEYWHAYENSMQSLKPHKLFQFLQKQRVQLSNPHFVHCLRFCSRYINEFYNNMLGKIQKQQKLLKEKFIMFFSADPIEFSKPYEGSNSKQQLPQYMQSSQQYKKIVQNEANSRTIILPTDYAMLDLSDKTQIPCQLVNLKSTSTNQYKKSRAHFQQKNQSLVHKFSQSTTNFNNSQQQVNDSKTAQSPRIFSPYEYFYMKKKLNESNLKWLQNSIGCKYLCIDTTVGAHNHQNVIGENEEGELIIFKKQKLVQLIDKLSAKIIFICLSNAHLATEMIHKRTKKEIVYFNFEKSSVTKNTAQNNQQVKQSLRFSYFRMTARKVIHLIIQRLISDTSQYKHQTKLYDAIKYIAHSYEFKIKNQRNEIVFYLSNQELKRTIMYFYGVESKIGCGHDNEQQCSEQHPGKIITIQLKEQDILSVEQVQQVKSVLKQKYNSKNESKAGIKIITHLNSFDKLYNIFQYYLEDKEQYELFQHIDLEEWKYPTGKDGLPFQLKQQKSGKSNPSVPQTIIRDISRVSNQSMDRKKKDKKSKELKVQPTVKYSHKWKSQFVNSLLKKNVLSWLLSNKKCFIMFSNSDLMNQKSDKYQQWAKNAFDNLFKLQNCDNGQHLYRVVTEVKIGILKKGEKKISSTASLLFMETNNKTDQ